MKGFPDFPDNRVKNICLDVAHNHKKWAESVDEQWKSEACLLSLQMLEEYLKESLEILAAKDYRYVEHRAHATGSIWGSKVYIDLEMRKIWLDLTNGDGTLYKNHFNCVFEETTVH